MAKQPDKKDILNYQLPIKDLKQQIADAIMEKYPPANVESEGVPVNIEAISTSMRVNYYFCGIKIEIENDKISVLETSSSFTSYRVISSRLLLALLLRHIKDADIDVLVEPKKKYRK